MKLLFGLVVALILVCVLVAALAAIMFTAVVGLAIGVPAYLLFRHWSGISHRVERIAQNPVERLQQLYVEGKIDLFEYERRVARLIAIEH